ncbi:thioredoxin family protein [Millionella massiliensis]|uniref:thioredoxin family protein n=1 Tax=Millionella massiliensis TaxID=1871023 RepID=UPI0024B6BC16|nr:thioredoxin family protein [Millionella massiliensis]
MEIKVLGPGCSRCKATYRVVEKVVRELGFDVQLSKVEDVVEMMRYPILTTPAVVVDGEVRIKGHVPSEEEVKQLLGH